MGRADWLARTPTVDTDQLAAEAFGRSALTPHDLDTGCDLADDGRRAAVDVARGGDRGAHACLDGPDHLEDALATGNQCVNAIARVNLGGCPRRDAVDADVTAFAQLSGHRPGLDQANGTQPSVDPCLSWSYLLRHATIVAHQHRLITFGDEGGETLSEEHKPITTEKALEGWRNAEQLAAVARRGKLAAQAAVRAAVEAEEAAMATAAAAKAALQSATLAETSAAKTAASARLVVENTRVNSADADAESAMADVDEEIAKDQYRSAAAAATERREGSQ